MAEAKLKVYYLSLKEDTPKKGYWDYGILEYLLKPFDYEEVDSLPSIESGIVVLPARSHKDYWKQLNEELKKIKNVVLFLMGDEEAVFPIEKIDHTNIKIWVQNPDPKKHSQYRRIGTGFAPIFNQTADLPEKSLNWFFAGQVTHSRREECVAELERLSGGEMLGTKGFTQGLKPADYFDKLASAKVAPCPSGPETPDSFRLFESLEVGCVPIADTQTPKADWDGFWEWLFDMPVPFPKIKNWESLPGYIKSCVRQYPMLNNRIQAFWLRYKCVLQDRLYDDLEAVGAGGVRDDVTIVIPVSPIKSHPQIHILSETIDSVRFHFPKARIIITFDGVRKEQEGFRDDYEEHIRRILWKSREWGNIYPVIFEEHRHQVGMARSIIDDIKTPLLVYVEQDTPLVIDELIEWDKLKDKIISGESNLIRFHFEAQVPKEHGYLMIGKPEDGLLKTVQWSQRPHLASTAFYRRLLSEQFSDKSLCFIEDLVHGRVIADFQKYGEQGWNQWRLHIYHPDGGNIKRSGNLDGRAGEKKYDELQIF